MRRILIQDISQEIYYEQLHNTSCTYQTMMWAVPGIFILLQAAFFEAIKFDDFLSWQNFIVLFSDSALSFSLWLQFQKTYIAGILLQDEINKIDKPERIPMFDLGSKGEKNLSGRMKEWDKKMKEIDKHGFYKGLWFAAKFSAAKWTSRISYND